MIQGIKKILGYTKDTHKIDKNDDFADFFYNAKSADKKKLIKRVMKRAIQRQVVIKEKASLGS